MSENTKIEWCDHTFNPWQGCRGVSPGCKFCYAEALTKRFGRDFKVRKRTGEENWKQPLKWDRKAAAGLFRQCSKCGKRAEYSRGPSGVLANCGGENCLFTDEDDSVAVRPRVFSLSMGDWLDDEVPIEWLADFLEVVRATPNLDWLLLTKRPENWRSRLVTASARMIRDVGEPGDAYTDETYSFVKEWLHGVAPQNVWMGTTVEDQARADERIPELLRIPARVRFLSCEPLLGPLDLSGGQLIDWENPMVNPIKWVIAGGESGPKARPMHPGWTLSLRDQCQAAAVPFFFKQWGEWAPQFGADGQPLAYTIRGKEEIFPDQPEGPDPFSAVLKIGKKAAGRLLDGREWSEFPSRRS